MALVTALARLVIEPDPMDLAKTSTNVKKELTDSRLADSVPNVSTGQAVSIVSVLEISPANLIKVSALPAKSVAFPRPNVVRTNVASSLENAFARHLITPTLKTEINVKAHANDTLAESTANVRHLIRPNVCANRAIPEIRPSVVATSMNAVTILVVQELCASTKMADLNADAQVDF